jgi:hypothetical protein
MFNCFSKILPFLTQREKYRKAGQVTDGKTAHAHCVLDN